MLNGKREGVREKGKEGEGMVEGQQRRREGGKKEVRERRKKGRRGLGKRDLKEGGQRYKLPQFTLLYHVQESC